MSEHYYIVFDVETTGLKPEESPITQFALSVLRSSDLEEVKKYETFVRPYAGLKLDKKIMAKTNVSLSDVMEGVESKQLVEVLTHVFKEYVSKGKLFKKPILIGHNVGFDLSFLDFLFRFHKLNLFDFIYPVLEDTLSYADKKWGNSIKSDDENSNLKLKTCCERMGIRLVDAHGAMSDVIATAELFRGFVNDLRNNDSHSNLVKGKSSTNNHRRFYKF